jgi:hypothetical protein
MFDWTFTQLASFLHCQLQVHNQSLEFPVVFPDTNVPRMQCTNLFTCSAFNAVPKILRFANYLASSLPAFLLTTSLLSGSPVSLSTKNGGYPAAKLTTAGQSLRLCRLSSSSSICLARRSVARILVILK